MYRVCKKSVEGFTRKMAVTVFGYGNQRKIWAYRKTRVELSRT